MSNAKALVRYVRERLEDGPNITFGKPTVRDLLAALEAAVTERDEALARRDGTEASLAHAYTQISQQADGIEKVSAANHALANKAQTAQTESARLRAERDWLANKLAELHDTSIMLVDGVPEGSNQASYWTEAARKATL